MVIRKKQYSLKAINVLLVFAMLLAGVAVNVSPIQAAAGDIVITAPAAQKVVKAGDTVDIAFTVDSTDHPGAGQYRIKVGETVFGPFDASFTGGVAQGFARPITIPAMVDGSYNLTVEVNFLGQAGWPNTVTKDDWVVVNNVEGVEITAPTETVYVKAADQVTVSFTVDDLVGDGTYEISIVNGTEYPFGPVSVPYEGGFNQPFEETIDIPSSVMLSDGTYDIKVVASDTGKTYEATLADILVVDNTPPATPVLTAPVGGEAWVIGTEQMISWEPYTLDEGDSISLSFSANDGVGWSPIAANVPNEDYAWTVPPIATTSAKIKIEVKDGVGNTAEMISGAFTIYAVDSSAPVVAMVAPEDGATVTVPLTLQASASDPQSGIAGVKFQDSADGIDWSDLTGDVTFVDGLYQLVVESLPAGTRYFRAIAENGIGLTATSEKVVVTVQIADTSPPIVTLVAPVDEEVVGFAYEFQVNASDGESGVVSMAIYALDEDEAEALLCEDPTYAEDAPNFSCIADVPAGTVAIKAVVTNGAGLEGSAQAAVVVDLDPPDLGAGLTTPAEGAVLKLGTPVNITWAEITDSTDVVVELELRRGGVKVADVINEWTVAGAPGNDYEVCMIATDEAGNEAEDCNAITIWGTDATPPIVSLTAPTPDDYNGIVELKATAADAETFIQKVEFFVSLNDAAYVYVGEDAVVPYDADAEYVYAWDTAGFADGVYSIKVVATNGVGLTESDSVEELTIDNTAPELSNMLPSTGAPISGEVTFSITAIDAGVGVESVVFEYFDGEDWVSSETTSESSVYSVTFDTEDVEDGWLTVRFTATDTLGNSAELEASYLVQNGEPSPNQAMIYLQEGWNLISLPLIPGTPAIETLLADLIAQGSVIQVVAWPYVDGALANEAIRWNVHSSQLSELEDGIGYWVEMARPGVLVFDGSVLPAPPEAPRYYVVYAGWNLIGFKSQQTNIDRDTYLGEAGGQNARMMYRFDGTGYHQVLADDNLVPGAGYWLAVSTNATIYPPAE